MAEGTGRDGRIERPSMTRGERVRAAARTLRTPRTASWVADETEVAVKTARKYLDQLVDDGVLRKLDEGDQPRYPIDQLMATYREVASEWEHLAERISVVRAALEKYDWASELDTVSA